MLIFGIAPFKECFKLEDLLVRLQGLIERVTGRQHWWKVLGEHLPLIVFHLRKKMQLIQNVFKSLMGNESALVAV